MFNLDADNAIETGECSIDVLVEKPRHLDEELMMLIQHVKKPDSWDYIIGILAISKKSGSVWFAVNNVCVGMC